MMAKAHVELPSGAKVTIEGTEAEVAKLVLALDGGGSSTASSKGKREKPGKTSGKTTVTDLINDLISDDFLKKPTELAAIKTALEQRGHYYPNPTIATALLRLVKRRQLRRVKQENHWCYVG